MADKKKDKKKRRKTTKGEIIFILILAVILALSIGAFFVVPELVKGRNPFEKMFEKKVTEEVEEVPVEEIEEDGEEVYAIGVTGYEENPDVNQAVNEDTTEVENPEEDQEMQ